MLNLKWNPPRIGSGQAVRTFDSLRLPGFRTFWLSMLGQWIAFNMLGVAKGWYLYKMTASPLLLGLLGASMGIPMFALSFLGGTIADRVDKRKLLIWGTLGQSLTMTALSLLVTFDMIVWWHLMIASAIQGIFFALTIPARQSAVPQMVDKSQLMNAMSLNTAGMNVAALAAPAAAGFLVDVDFVGIMGVWWLIAGMFFLSGLIMLFIPALPPTAEGRSQNVARNMAAGLAFVRKDMALMLLVVLTFIVVVFGTPLNNLLPVFSEDILKVGASGLGMLNSFCGLGALIGSLAIASLGDFRRKGITLLLLAFFWGAAMMAFTATRIYPLALVLLIPVGIGQSARNVIVNTIMLTRSPPDMRGRVISLNMMTWGLQPLGLLPIGAAAEYIGAPLAVGIGGGAVAVLALVFLAMSPTLRKL
jgi:MFS family permease